jgi:L-threonylcarbamoyladenylate synthase
VNAVVEALRAGEAVVVPTETVYGLATLPTATARIFELKGRAPDVPLAVLCADPRQALGLVDEPTDAVRRVGRELWPGPLTLVLPRRPGLGYELGEPATTIGVRCPDHDLVRFIAAQVGPIAVTSANLHGQPTPRSAAAIARLFGEGVAAVVDGGELTGTPSTVLDATAPDPSAWRVLRQGGVSLADVLAHAEPAPERG